MIKKPYKIIQYDSQFGPELKYVVPFAYWHYKNGTLLKTISSKYTKAFYFFSPDHEERFDKRVWVDFKYDIEIRLKKPDPAAPAPPPPRSEALLEEIRDLLRKGS